MTKANRLRGALLALALTAIPAHAQLNVNFGGERNAADYAYGWPGIGAPALNVSSGNSATGAGQVITLVTGSLTMSNGARLSPISTTAPIYVGIAANAEIVTPTAVSNCNLPTAITPGPGTPQCTITATFVNTHGPQEPVYSATYGLQEALNASAGTGGVVVVSPGWATLGGTNAKITAATGYSNVSIVDTRGTGAPYWTLQPTTLTALTAPTTLTATNIVFIVATGTWAASSTHFIATCVDILGGESPGSADYTQTPTVNYTLTVPVAPTCSTGAVGWRLYAGTTSAAVSYLLPVTAANCTLATAETTIAACSLTATNATWGPTFTTTTAQAPLGLGVTNQDNPVPQSHTTFGYQASALPQQLFQTQYGPFGSGTVATATATDVTMLGTVQLPAGYLNAIGRTIRLTGKIDGAGTAGGTVELITALGWVGGDTAGLPVTVCDTVGFAVLGTQTYTIPFSCTLITNAVGATAVGTLQPDSFLLAGGAAGTTNILATEASAGAIASLGLFAQDSLNIYLKPATHDMTAVRLMDLHVETLQ